MSSYRLTQEQQELATQWMGLPKRIVNLLSQKPEISRALSDFGEDDAIAIGYEVLCCTAYYYRPDRGAKFVTYAWIAIQRRVLQEIFRKRVQTKRLLHDNIPDEGPSVVDYVIDAEQREMMARGISLLLPEDLEVINSILQKTKPSEMVQKLGIHTNTWTWRRNRAIERLVKASKRAVA